MTGVLAMAAATALIGQISSPWQLYAVNALLAFGWAGTSLGMITNTLGLWFNARRGMAISLALNGASFGGIVGVPLMVAAIGLSDFPGAMMAAAIVDDRAADPCHTCLRGATSRSRHCRDGFGGRCAIGDAHPRAGVSRRRVSDRIRRVRAGAVRAGWLHCSSDFVSGSRDRPRTRRHRGRAVDGDGGGRAGCCSQR